MARISRVIFDLRPMKRAERQLRTFAASPAGAAALDGWRRQAAARVLAWLQRRYVRYSRGGGDWRALSIRTVRKRRKGRRKTPNAKVQSLAIEKKRGVERLVSAGGVVAILRNTGTLFRAFSMGSPGNYVQPVAGGVEVGIGGPGKHPNAPMTIGRLAQIHNKGEGNMPKRVIVPDEVDAATAAQVQADLARVIRRIT